MFRRLPTCNATSTTGETTACLRDNCAAASARSRGPRTEAVGAGHGGEVHPADVQDRDGAISSQTVSTRAPTCVKLSPNSASGPSRSSNTPLTLPAFNCYRAAGSSNEPWLGSTETAAWQKISRRRLRAPRRGFTSPLYSSSSGDWLDAYARYLRYNTTLRFRFRHLEADRN
jgi:hypothetical protein